MQAKRVVAANESREDRIKRALGYPYARPNTSYVFVNGDVFLIDNQSWSGVDGLSELRARNAADTSSGSRTLATILAEYGVPAEELRQERVPVLAIGSNAGPEQLRRKYPADLFPHGTNLIPVLQCVLEDFDVVYAPLVTSYGSCSATLEHSPGTRTELFLTLLTQPQLQRMHETEGAYNLCELTDVRLHVACSLDAFRQGRCSPERLQGAVLQYNHQCGTLYVPLAQGDAAVDSPVALAAIPAAQRKFPALEQQHMQLAVRHALGAVDGTSDSRSGDGRTGGALRPVQLPGSVGEACEWAVSRDTLEEWVLSNLNDEALRRQRVARLVDSARPFGYSRAEVKMTIGSFYARNVK